MEDDSYFEDEEFSPIKSLLGLLTFSTILPINVFTSIEYMTKLTWCWPFLHIFIGVLAAICGYVSLEILHLNSFFTAAIVYAFLMIITGYNHLDGVMDMADGVMVHGEPEKKIRIMKDSSVIVATISYMFGGFAGLAGVIGAMLSGMIIATVAKRNFVLANGDVLGMSNEVGRLLSLLFMAVALFYF